MSNTSVHQMKDVSLQQLAEQYVRDVKRGNDFPMFVEQLLIVLANYNGIKWQGQIRDLILEIANAAYKEGFTCGRDCDDKAFPEY